MHSIEFIIPQDLEPYVNCIMVQESDDPNGHVNLPFYADGYPGIMFQEAENGFYLLPRGKPLSTLFLYGQTIEPISLDVKGPFKFIVFQLYPFASRYLLGVDPKKLNDDCFDLVHIKPIVEAGFEQALLETKDLHDRIQIMTQVMHCLIQHYQLPGDDQIQQAINMILQHAGQLSVRQMREAVYLSERTFERKFMSEVGLSPKQFARIIQFQSALHQMNEDRYQKLVEVGLDSGFADQSHFIRTFKKYTGQTPSFYLKQITSR